MSLKHGTNMSGEFYECKCQHGLARIQCNRLNIWHASMNGQVRGAFTSKDDAIKWLEQQTGTNIVDAAEIGWV